jgi:arginyl-tRNA---protein transferase
MKHYIDGELAIVGVLDYTGTTVSSNYLFYDPKWRFLSPGTLAAIREIEHVRKIRTKDHIETRYYNQSRFFPKCKKSVYKMNLRPL